MFISIFDLFTVGVGPSSSHTVGPMRAAKMFLEILQSQGFLKSVDRLVVDLYGSLALTGKGHRTDVAVILGLEGFDPAVIDPEKIDEITQTVVKKKRLYLGGSHQIAFDPAKEIRFHMRKQLPYHPNGMRFSAYAKKKLVKEMTYYSVGGGHIISHEAARQDASFIESEVEVPYPFEKGEELLAICRKERLSISEVMRKNEESWHQAETIGPKLLNIWHVMEACMERGCKQTGLLPGGLKVRRRASQMRQQLLKDPSDSMQEMEWVSLWALAVNEENAAGGRVVTAPTNGSAGVIPAVLKYYTTLKKSRGDEGIIDFLLTAGAICILYKKGASISAAEMGCMGEVGVACSMAAAGLTAALGGTPEQIENAAEIGMEHNLGLTCDPIMGLVQIPCIERNTMGAVTAINSAMLALRGDGTHRVSLDQVIATMRQTGHDMRSIYKETALGGLAVNVPEC